MMRLKKQRQRFQKILDKLELIEKAVNKLNEEKPKQIKKTNG